MLSTEKYHELVFVVVLFLVFFGFGLVWFGLGLVFFRERERASESERQRAMFISNPCYKVIFIIALWNMILILQSC